MWSDRKEFCKLEKEHHPEDLGIRRTETAIKESFIDLLCEKPYSEISVKELAYRAGINRKTFYLHYDGLEQLMEELQEEIIENYTGKNISYRSLKEIKSIIRYFFKSAVSAPPYFERLLCSRSYRSILETVNKRIMSYRHEQNIGAFGLREAAENLVFVYFGANSILLYRQWVADRKKVDLETLIKTATTLICNGLSAFVKDE